MIHECNVYCHSDIDMMELIGKESEGLWLPFAFDISLVDAVKMSSGDSSKMLYKCSTVFLQSGETFSIDTKYKDFLRLWKDFTYLQEDGESFGGEDLEL